MLVISLNTT